jgi:cellobiose phosphorylase
MNEYGYFDDKAREYVITNPRTPVKWINYIGTLQFGGIVDHTGGSLLCAGDPALNRIVKYLPQLPNSEFKGETLYVRIREADGYTVFSPFFVPTLTPYDKYECHVGLGYQRIVSVMHNIQTEVTIFVPNNELVEVRDIKITNLSDQPREIDIIPVVEYTHFDALKQFTNADWVPQTMMSDALREADGKIILQQYAFMRRGGQTNFFTANTPVDSFETDRKIFLGDNEYGTWQAPRALEQASLDNNEARRGDVIGALLIALGTIAPGETKRTISLLGQATPEKIPVITTKYRNPQNVEQALAELKDYWDDYLSHYTCDTPSTPLNSMINVHNPRQCYMTLNWSRYLSLYQLGLGARGLGFRDSSQDVMGALMSAPDDCKSLLEKLLSIQRTDGSAMHQFFPLTMEANEGDAREEGDKLVYGDDHLWVVLAVCAYLKETGDYDFLDQEITFYDKEKPLEERKKATVLTHLTCALDYTTANTGKNGLPLLGFADWNDTVNLPGNAESMFNASLYGRALLEMTDLMEFLKRDEDAELCRSRHAKMREMVNKNAWDGQWYIRYFDQNGEPIGSSSNSHGKIFTNAQSWAVLSGFADKERAATALESVNKMLNTECGIKLSTPGYNGFDPAIGGVTTYPPGAKENGGIFLHSNPWVMIAETMLGNGKRAFQYYLQINPAAKNSDIDRYECEPYCYAQNILGDEHPQFGLGRNSWLSGTASWTYQAATQYILGVRPEHDGLRIDPCIPNDWDGFSITRNFRGATYQITVKNPQHVSKGVKAVTVDGAPIEGSLVPIFADGKTHTVEVTMGS